MKSETMGCEETTDSDRGTGRAALRLFGAAMTQVILMIQGEFS